MERLIGSIAPQTPELRIKSIWPEVVGAALAAHSRPVSLSGRTLSVECSGSVYAQELELQSRTILERLSEMLGDGSVEKVRFTVTGRR